MSVNLDMCRVEYRSKIAEAVAHDKARLKGSLMGGTEDLWRGSLNLCLVKVRPQPMSGWSRVYLPKETTLTC